MSPEERAVEVVEEALRAAMSPFASGASFSHVELAEVAVAALGIEQVGWAEREQRPGMNTLRPDVDAVRGARFPDLYQPAFVLRALESDEGTPE